MIVWHLVTRLGEMQIVLPLLIWSMWTAWQRGVPAQAMLIWACLQIGAIAVTTVSKVAFIGWGLGWPLLNFTGVSGHAMFAASLYPVLLGAVVCRAQSAEGRVAWLVGVCLAIAVAVSRVVLGAHSTSEVVMGLLLGGTASTYGLLLKANVERFGINALLVAGVWLVVMATQAPALHSHAVVTRLALTLSGHERPYTRAQLLRRRGPASRASEPLFHASGNEVASAQQPG